MGHTRRLRLRLLGHMAVSDTSERNYLPRTRKTRALLAILAMASPKPVMRLPIAALLWSRREKEQAGASLRQAVHELQETLAPDWSHVLITDRHHLSLRGSQLDIDALSLMQPTEPQEDVLDRFDQILLEDLSGLDPAFDRWLEDERARLVRIARTIGEGLLVRCVDPVTAIATAERLLNIDRTHEGAWRTIMRSHAERGDLGAAAAAYGRCRGMLAETGDGRPSLETEELIDRIRAQAQASPAEMPDPVRSAGTLQSGVGWGGVERAGVERARVEQGGAERAGIGRTGIGRAAAGRGDARPERLSLRLRVAPFRTIGLETNDGLAIGLAEEVSAGMSRFRWISCVPATLWPNAAGGEEPSDHRGDLDADLVLNGTIQHSAARVRIIVRLLDMRAGGEIAWAGRFDRAMTDQLSLQEELGAAIVAQVDPELMQHEGRRMAGRDQHDKTAQDFLLQALPGIYRMDRSSFTDARQLLEMSLRADPGSSVAHGWLAYWDLLHVGQGWSADPLAASAEAARLAERAVMLDPGDARALTLAGHVRSFLGRHPEEAIALHERAIALNPNLAIAWCFSGLSHVYCGRHDEGLRRINMARRLSPSDPHVFFFDTSLIIVQLLRGDYASAAEAGRRAIELNPLFSSAYKSYLAALGLMDRDHQAKEVLARLLELEPGFTVEAAVLRSPFIQAKDIARYAEGLRRAGLPENDLVLSRRKVLLTIDHSLIDLVSVAPQNPDLI